MKREEAIKLLKQYQGYEPMFPDGETLKHAFDLTDETVDTLLSALRPTSQEQVEKAWKGKWEMVSNGKGICSKCHRQDGIDPLAKFCRYCGAPMTDEAVEMVMENLEAMQNDL